MGMDLILQQHIKPRVLAAYIFFYQVYEFRASHNTICFGSKKFGRIISA